MNISIPYRDMHALTANVHHHHTNGVFITFKEATDMKSESGSVLRKIHFIR